MIISLVQAFLNVVTNVDIAEYIENLFSDKAKLRTILSNIIGTKGHYFFFDKFF